MRTITTMYLKALTLFMFMFVLMGMSQLSHAGLQQLQVAELSQIDTARRMDYNDSHFAKITYVGSSTEAVLTISSWTVTSYAPEGTADTNFGTAGTYDVSAAAYDTMGELCTAINALSDYTCTLTGGKPDDDPKYLLDQTAASGTNNLKAAGGYSIILDSGTYAATVAQHMRIGITPGDTQRVTIERCFNNGEGTVNLEVSGKLREFEGTEDGVTRNEDDVVWVSAASTDDTDEYYPVDSVTAPINEWLEFGRGERVVISYNAAAALTSTNSLWCEWIVR